jgi:hypothetical protein
MSLNKNVNQRLRSVFLGERNLSKTYAVLLDMKSPYIINTGWQFRFANPLKLSARGLTKEERDDILYKNGYDSIATPDELIAYKAEQIHILGSEQDIENFKKFVEKEKPAV